MNIISALAETFNFLLFHVFSVLQNFLQLNFTVVSIIIKYFEQLKGTVVLNVSSAFHILKCCYEDFVIFLYEVISITGFIINVVSDFSYKLYVKVIYILCQIHELVYAVHENVSTFLVCIQFCVLQIYELATYIIQLIFKSFVLLLQLGPNLLILLYEAIVYCLCFLYTSANCCVESVIENLCMIFWRSSEAIYSIPMKAYCGALLCIAFYYQRKNVYTCFKQYFRYLSFFIWNLGLKTSTWIKPLLNIFSCGINKVKCFFLSERPEVFYDASSDDSNLESNVESVQKTSVVKYGRKIKDLCSKILLRNSYYIEEQVKQLENELIAEREKHICIICFDKPRSVIFYPCRHMCVCDDCGRNLIAELHGCPLCRSNVQDAYHVFM